MALTVQALDAPYSATQRFLITAGTAGDTLTASIDDGTIAGVDPLSATLVVGSTTFTVSGLNPGATTLHISDPTTGESVPWTINVSGTVTGPSSTTVAVNQTATLIYKEDHDPAAFSISVADTTIATITISANSEGYADVVVKGVAVGSTTITVDDGHGNTKTTTVTVEAVQVPQLVQKARNRSLSGAPTATLPGNPTVGNLIVALVFHSGGAPSTGWTRWCSAAGSFHGGLAANDVSVYTHVVAFGDTPTFSPTAAGGEVYLLEFQGVDTSNPFNCASFVMENGSVANTIPRWVTQHDTAAWDAARTTYTTPSIIPSVIGCLPLYVGALSAALDATTPLLTQPDNVDTWDNVIAADSPASTWSGSGSDNYVVGPGGTENFAGSTTQSVTGPTVNGAPFTLEFVFEYTPGAQTLFQCGFNSSTGGTGVTIYNPGAAGAWYLGTNGNIGISPQVDIREGDLAQPMHLAVVYDGSNITAYINGEPLGSAVVGTLNFDTNGPAVLGGRAEWNGTSLQYSSFMTGKINKYAFFNAALSDEKIWSHYQSVKTIYGPTIQSVLEESYTTIFADVIPFGPVNLNVIATQNTLTSDTTTPLQTILTSSLIDPIQSGYEPAAAVVLYLTPAQPQPPPAPRATSNMVKIVISDPTGKIVQVFHRGLVGSQFVDEVNGGNTTATLVLYKKFVDTSWFGADPSQSAPYDYRVQFWLKDSIDPWWDGRIIDWDPEQQQNSEFITLQCEGWNTYLDRAIVTEELSPGVQPNGINNGIMDADTYLAHLAARYVDSSKFGNGSPAKVCYLEPIPVALDKLSFDGSELSRCIDQVVKGVEDDTGHTFEWWVRGTLSLGTPTTGHPAIVIQKNQIPNSTPGVGFGLVTGRIAPTDSPVTYGYIFEFVDSTMYDYKVVNSSANLYNMIALYGGKDPVTQQQVYGPFKDSTSISLYGLRQKKVTNNNLLSQTSLTNYATAWLLLHGYPQPQGTYKTFIPHDGRRAGRWMQIHVPGNKKKNIQQKIEQVRAVKVVTTIEDTERILQEVYTTAPRPFIDHAFYAGTLNSETGLAGSTKRLNTTMLANYFVQSGGDVRSITNAPVTDGTGTASVVINHFEGAFNQTPPTVQGVPAIGIGYTVNLADTVTGATGDGHYEVNFALDLNKVLGTGSGAGFFCTKIAAGGSPVFSPFLPTGVYDDQTVPVHKCAAFTVVGGQIVGWQDTRVLGGVSSDNIQTGAISESLADLTDVSLSALTDGQVLEWVATDGKWENKTPSGLSNVSVSSPQDNQALQYDSGTSDWINKNLTITEVAALPTADSAHNGQIVRVLGGGTTPDKLYACRERSDGTFIWTRFQGRSLVLKMCSADFTPTVTGTDLGGLVIVPYDPEENSDVIINWKVVKITLRVETQGSTSTSVNIQRSTGTGNFSNSGNLLSSDLTVAASVNEASSRTFAVGTVNSGDKLMPNYTALGTSAAGFTLQIILRES